MLVPDSSGTISIFIKYYAVVGMMRGLAYSYQRDQNNIGLCLALTSVIFSIIIVTFHTQKSLTL